MAIGFTHELTRDDSGEVLATLSDQIAEGETKTYEVTVSDPKITGDITETTTSAEDAEATTEITEKDTEG